MRQADWRVDGNGDECGDLVDDTASTWARAIKWSCFHVEISAPPHPTRTTVHEEGRTPVSTATPDQRRVTRLPDDPNARLALQSWVDSGFEGILIVTELDFRGLDVSGLHIFETWAMECDFRGARLVATDIAGAHLYRSDFRDADMTGIVMPNADATEVNFSGAIMHVSNVRSVEAPDSRLQRCDLSGSQIGGGFRRADLRGASLSDVEFLDLDLRGANLSTVQVAGASGTVYGPFLADVDGEERLVAGEEAQAWLASRGADVHVLSIG